VPEAASCRSAFYTAGVTATPKQLTKYVARAGITKKTSPHTLRWTFATHKSQKGVPLRQIQEMLGHADLKTTSFYIGNDKVELQRVQEATSL
jgi:site-specific recombinase XerD